MLPLSGTNKCEAIFEGPTHFNAPRLLQPPLASSNWLAYIAEVLWLSSMHTYSLVCFLAVWAALNYALCKWVSPSESWQRAVFLRYSRKSAPEAEYIATNYFVAFAIPPDDMVVMNCVCTCRGSLRHDLKLTVRDDHFGSCWAGGPQDPPRCFSNRCYAQQSQHCPSDVIQHYTALWFCILDCCTQQLCNILGLTICTLMVYLKHWSGDPIYQGHGTMVYCCRTLSMILLYDCMTTTHTQRFVCKPESAMCAELMASSLLD